MKGDLGGDGGPQRALDDRLARGEISQAEYDALHQAMGRRRSGGGSGGRPFSRSALVALVVLGVVLAFAVTSVALRYAPWGAPQDGGSAQDGRSWWWENCCSWGGGMGGMMGGDSGGGDSEVLIVGYAFAPAELTVPAGTTVTWVNMDHVMHTVSFGEHGEAHEEGPGESGPMYHMGGWSRTFDEPGVFAYHCDPHPTMTGQVIVEG